PTAPDPLVAPAPAAGDVTPDIAAAVVVAAVAVVVVVVVGPPELDEVLVPQPPSSVAATAAHVAVSAADFVLVIVVPLVRAGFSRVRDDGDPAGVEPIRSATPAADTCSESARGPR